MAVSTRERNMLIALGVVVVLAGAVFLLTRGGGAPEEEAAPTQPASPPPALPSPTPPPEERPPGFTFFAGRDPFNPLVVPEEDLENGEQPPPEETPAPPVSPVPPGEEEEEREGITIGGHQVVLDDIFVRNGQEMAQVRVDGEVHVVAEGEDFADNFRLVSISGGCADFLFGDQSFTLCEPGERK